MARTNHNANYIYDVDGETVWEKLRVIREMLYQREQSLALAILDREEEQNKNLDLNSYEYKKMMIIKPQQDRIIQECEDEVIFLKEFESFLTIEAEKTRISGKTDDEMYEINFFDELKYRLVRRAQAQIISSGRIHEETLLRILKNKEILNLCISEGLLTTEAFNFVQSKKLPSSDLTTSKFLEYQSDNSSEEN